MTPVKPGLAPSAFVIENVSAGMVERGLRGSFKTFKVSSPVLVRVAETLRLETPLTAEGPKS